MAVQPEEGKGKRFDIIFVTSEVRCHCLWYACEFSGSRLSSHTSNGCGCILRAG